VDQSASLTPHSLVNESKMEDEYDYDEKSTLLVNPTHVSHESYVDYDQPWELAKGIFSFFLFLSQRNQKKHIKIIDGTSTFIKDLPEAKIVDSKDNSTHKLSQWPATAICGNDITSSCLYVIGLCTYSVRIKNFASKKQE
jgi:hypothetical protein